MKNFIILLILIPLAGSAQTKKDIFNPQVPMVFLGIDFTRVMFTKSDEFTNKPEILRFFVDANNQIDHGSLHNLMENQLDRKTVVWDLSYVTKVNSQVNWEAVYSDNTDYTVSDAEIENIVKNLHIDQVKYKDHIGMVLVEENCCKTKPLQTISCVFFNVNDHKVLFTKRYEMKPSGIGFYNYWSVNHNMLLARVGKLKKETE
jgi:hypothetical protein